MNEQADETVMFRRWRVTLACGEYAEFGVAYHPGTANEAAAISMDVQFEVGAKFQCQHGPCAVAAAAPATTEEST